MCPFEDPLIGGVPAGCAASRTGLLPAHDDRFPWPGKVLLAYEWSGIEITVGCWHSSMTGRPLAVVVDEVSAPMDLPEHGGGLGIGPGEKPSDAMSCLSTSTQLTAAHQVDDLVLLAAVGRVRNASRRLSAHVTDEGE